MTKTISALSMASLLCLGGVGLTACDVPDEGPELGDEEELGEKELGEAGTGQPLLLPRAGPELRLDERLGHGRLLEFALDRRLHERRL